MRTMNPDQASSLYHLQRVWEDSYEIRYAEGAWSARRRGDVKAQPLTAASAADLRELLVEDYALRQETKRASDAAQALPSDAERRSVR
jgi:hypothetical protein